MALHQLSPSLLATKKKVYATIKLPSLPALPSAFKDDAPMVSDYLPVDAESAIGSVSKSGGTEE
jgi:hypothetical protein